MKSLRLIIKHYYFIPIVVAVTFFALGAFFVLLTPLKWINLSEPAIRDIDPTVFYQEYQANPDSYLFLDVRDQTTYSQAHAKYALSEPIVKLYDDHYALPKSGKTIVLMCSSGRLAGVAYGYLQREGFLNIERIQGGLNEWKSEGLPVVGDSKLIPPHD